MNLSPVAGVVALLLAPGALVAQEKPADPVRALIERLVEVKQPYLGSQYAYAGGRAFLPYSYATTDRALKDPDDPLLALVKLGPKAVPALLEHLSDDRKTKSAMEHSGGFGFMSIGCDKGDEGKVEEEPKKMSLGGVRYTFRVGDFCYAALGQIVNRDYDLAHYQPSNIHFVVSVPHTKQLIADVRKEWTGLTPEKHRALLVKDFETERSDGASVRLAYYYPELLEAHALQQLERGNQKAVAALRYDRSTKLDHAVRDVLLKTDDDSLAVRRSGRLAGRGFDKDIEAYILRRSAVGEADALKELKRRLGWTRLHAAVDADVPALIEQALGDKVDVNARSRTGETALHLTTEYGRAEVLELLLRAKADPNVADGNGKLPIEDLAYGDSERCVRMLIAAGSKVPNVYAAVVLGDAGRLAEMLKREPELANARNRYGEPVLQMAADRGATDVLRVLLDANARIDAVGRQTNRGISKEYTALHAAVEGGKTAAVKLLLERGADPNVIDKRKKAPLHYAAGTGNVEVVNALLAHKADLTLKDNFGRTPLNSATKEVREAVADWEKGKK